MNKTKGITCFLVIPSFVPFISSCCGDRSAYKTERGTTQILPLQFSLGESIVGGIILCFWMFPFHFFKTTLTNEAHYPLLYILITSSIEILCARSKMANVFNRFVEVVKTQQESVSPLVAGAVAISAVSLTGYLLYARCSPKLNYKGKLMGILFILNLSIGKVVVVTGASSGIGEYLARDYAAQGAK
jgi:hypothetical protein